MFHKWNTLSVGAKLVAATVSTVLVIMVTLTLVLSSVVASAMRSKAESTMHHQVDELLINLKTFDSQLKNETGKFISQMMNRWSGPASVDNERLMLSGKESLPTLKIGGEVINQVSEELDKLILLKDGVYASIAVKKGDDFYRVATNIKNASGERQNGLPLGQANPARTLLLEGKEFVGKSQLTTGDDIMVRWVPIKSADGRVIGAFGAAVNFAKSLENLKTLLLSVKVGDSGYPYAVDLRAGAKFGQFTLHPKLSGQSGLGIKDADGHEPIREMVEKRNGTLAYRWQNADETAPREKLAAFAEFPEWNWMIAVATYTEELTNESTLIRKALIISSVVIVLLMAGITVFITRRQISRPLGVIAQVMTNIGRGNLNNAIQITSQDEIGQLQQAMQQMQTSLSGLVDEIRGVVARAEQGDFSHSISVANKEGFGREVGESLNSLVRVTDEGLSSIATVAQALAAGDLSQSITRSFPGTFGSTVQGMNTTVKVLNEVIGEVRAVVNAASEGNFSQTMNASAKQGYARTLAELLNRLSANANEALSDISRVASALAQGNLTQQIDKQYPGLFGQTAQGINTTVANLRDLVGNVVESVQAINSAAGEISAGNRDLSGRTEQQASSLEETAASMEELTSMVRHNTENARQANELAQTSSSIADKGGAVVKASVQTMEDIATSSRKISDIISVIDGIAFQTNILALNAAVEAARAGEQGRGFAVVASEVRNLALRAAGAAKEIKDLITESVEKVERGTAQAEEAGSTMEEIVGSIARVSHIIADISSASGEQTSGIEQVNAAVVEMDRVTQQNAALVEQAAAAAESLEDQARQLQELMNSFRL